MDKPTMTFPMMWLEARAAGDATTAIYNDAVCAKGILEALAEKDRETGTWRDLTNEYKSDFCDMRDERDALREGVKELAGEIDRERARCRVAADEAESRGTRLTALEGALRELLGVVDGLADQQAMPDDFYKEPAARAQSLLTKEEPVSTGDAIHHEIETANPQEGP